MGDRARGRNRAGLWPQEAFVWEASDPYLICAPRRTAASSGGGEDEEFCDEDRRDALIPREVCAAVEEAEEAFPDIDAKPEFAWAGSFGTTTTGLPYIGQVPRHPRIHAVMGYGGNGITYSQVASEIVASAIDGPRRQRRRSFRVQALASVNEARQRAVQQSAMPGLYRHR